MSYKILISRSWLRPASSFCRRGIAVAGAVAACWLVAACNTSKEAMADTPRPTDSTAIADSLAKADTALPAREPTQVTRQTPDTTLGERLGQLDAQIRNATPEELPALEAEYQRLLELATRSNQIQTGRDGETPETADGSLPEAPLPDSDLPSETEPTVSDVPDETVDSTGLVVTDLPAEPSPDAKFRGPDGLKGFRKTELSAAGLKAPASAPAGTARRATTRRPAAQAQPVVVREPAPNASTARDQRYVNGMVASRAGRYTEAARDLPAVVASPPAGKQTTARYAYAESLEKSGRLTQAADEYRRAAAGTDAMGQKSYVSYCRVLAKSGERARARQLLVNFISRNPKSTQVVAARQLLQTL